MVTAASAAVVLFSSEAATSSDVFGRSVPVDGCSGVVSLTAGKVNADACSVTSRPFGLELPSGFWSTVTLRTDGEGSFVKVPSRTIVLGFGSEEGF